MVDERLTDLLWDLLDDLAEQAAVSPQASASMMTGVAYGKTAPDSALSAAAVSVPAALYLCHAGSQQWPRFLRVRGSSLVH